MTKPVRSLEFDPAGFEDLAWWIEKDRKKALRIVKVLFTTLASKYRLNPAKLKKGKLIIRTPLIWEN